MMWRLGRWRDIRSAVEPYSVKVTITLAFNAYAVSAAAWVMASPVLGMVETSRAWIRSYHALDFSTRQMTLCMVCTAFSGNLPAALSALSIKASAPSKVALATSETSARVGDAFSIMLSSIWVATITGLPSCRHLRMIFFWIDGTSSMGHSTPKSPLATIMASDASMMFSMRFTALGISIFARTAALPSTLAFTSKMSCSFWTKETATQSTPFSRPNSRSCQSFSVTEEMGRSTPGRFTPLRLEIVPPSYTLQVTLRPCFSTTFMRTMPSLMYTLSPLVKMSKISGWGRLQRFLSPSSGLSSMTKKSPSSRSCFAWSLNAPRRILGPCKSCKMVMGLPCFSSSLRIFSMLVLWVA